MASRGTAFGRVLRWLLLAAVVVAVVAVVRGSVPCEVLAAQPACQVALQPGPVEDTLGLVTITGAEVFPPEGGALHLTTVSVQDDLGVGGWLTARTNPAVEVVPRDQLYPPGIDREELREINAAAMRDSQQVATIVALEELGYELDPDGAVIVAIQADAVTDALTVGDVIIGVDGAPVRESTEVVEAVRARQVGDTIRFEVREDGDRQALRTVAVELGRNPTDPALPYVGVLLTTDLDLPVDIDVDVGAIGGPSAGLLFALSLLELLGPEDLLDGRIIAGTGTLSRDGTVGGVGGVPQKVAGASAPRNGAPPAEAFLVPRDNLAAALSARVQQDLLVVPVGTLEEALAALADLRLGRRPEGSEVVVAR